MKERRKTGIIYVYVNGFFFMRWFNHEPEEARTVFAAALKAVREKPKEVVIVTITDGQVEMVSGGNVEEFTRRTTEVVELAAEASAVVEVGGSLRPLMRGLLGRVPGLVLRSSVCEALQPLRKRLGFEEAVHKAVEEGVFLQEDIEGLDRPGPPVSYRSRV